MIRAHEERKARRTESQKELEAALRSSLSEEENRRWQVLSEAVARVQTRAA
jgi:hypothetical protein